MPRDYLSALRAHAVILGTDRLRVKKLENLWILKRLRTTQAADAVDRRADLHLLFWPLGSLLGIGSAYEYPAQP